MVQLQTSKEIDRVLQNAQDALDHYTFITNAMLSEYEPTPEWDEKAKSLIKEANTSATKIKTERTKYTSVFDQIVKHFTGIEKGLKLQELRSKRDEYAKYCEEQNAILIKQQEEAAAKKLHLEKLRIEEQAIQVIVSGEYTAEEVAAFKEEAIAHAEIEHASKPIVTQTSPAVRKTRIPVVKKLTAIANAVHLWTIAHSSLTQEEMKNVTIGSILNWAIDCGTDIEGLEVEIKQTSINR